MDTLNSEYFENYHKIKYNDDMYNVEKSINNMIILRNELIKHHPEYRDAITDIDYLICRGSYRINNIKLIEEIIPKYHNTDYRFKKLYHMLMEIETANVWRNVIEENNERRSKIFLRASSVIILTGALLCVIFRK